MSGPSPRVRWLARVVCTLPLLLLLGDVGKAIPSAASEDPMRAFWMTQHDQGRQTLSLVLTSLLILGKVLLTLLISFPFFFQVTSRGNTVQCTFDYDTNTWTDTVCPSPPLCVNERERAYPFDFEFYFEFFLFVVRCASME